MCSVLASCLCKGTCRAQVHNEYVRNLIFALILEIVACAVTSMFSFYFDSTNEMTEISLLVLSRHLLKFGLKFGIYLS